MTTASNSQALMLTTVVDQRLIELRLNHSDAARYLDAAKETAVGYLKTGEHQAAFDHLEAMRWKFHDASVKLERYEAEKCQRQVLVTITEESLNDWC
jgi:hypothetical protein